MVGALTEDDLRCLLTESGEMRRWKEAEHETPEGFQVLYPPPPLDTDALIRLAEAAFRLEQLDDVPSLEEPQYLGEKTLSPVEPQKRSLLPHSPRTNQGLPKTTPLRVISQLLRRACERPILEAALG
jgi:hypothetical protein